MKVFPQQAVSLARVRPMSDQLRHSNGALMALVLGALLLALPPLALAKTPEERGLEIATEMDKRSDGAGDMTATLKMILKNKQGNTSERQMRMKTKEGTDQEGGKGLVVFDTPKDQRGTALLTHSHTGKPDDQWLYLPALKRVKRIASKNKSGPFMGSEFSFEDMSAPDVEEFDYKFLREEEYNGQMCFVVESYPKDSDSGYTKRVSWIDKAEYRVLKVDYYDRKKSHLKTLIAENYALHNNTWQPDRMLMTNLQTGKSSELLWSERVFLSEGLPDSDFTQNSLKRAR